ncbi:MAG: peptidase A26, partial [Bacillota bacterium]
AGYNAGSIANVYSTGTVTGSGTVGGLVGLNSGTVQTSYTTSEVAVTGSDGTGGGLAGENDQKIINAYSTGKVSGVAGSTLGGLVGYAGSGSSITASAWDTNTSGQTAGA